MSAFSNPDPLVSIVTPSRNMGRFIRATIDSVLSQTYPRIEYVVIDGASTDDTRDILASYGSQVQWISEPDNGQAAAINRGFARTQGEIFAFLNADDTYLPDAVATAVAAFHQHPKAAVVYGEADHVDENGNRIEAYPTGSTNELAERCSICQPATFIRREAFPGVSVNRHYALDYELWLKLIGRGEFVRLPQLLARSRMHRDNKTLGDRGKALRETIDVMREHFGYAGFEPVYAYANWLVDGKDQFFEKSGPSFAKFQRTFREGLAINPDQRFRWTRECFAEAAAFLKRRLS